MRRNCPWVFVSLRRACQQQGGSTSQCVLAHTGQPERRSVTPHSVLTDWRVTVGAQLGRPALVLVCVAAAWRWSSRQSHSGGNRADAAPSRSCCCALPPWDLPVGCVAAQRGAGPGQPSAQPCCRAGGRLALDERAPPDRGPSRAQRAAQIVADAGRCSPNGNAPAPRRDLFLWRGVGHGHARVLARGPAGRRHPRGEALSELRGAWPVVTWAASS